MDPSGYYFGGAGAGGPARGEALPGDLDLPREAAPDKASSHAISGTINDESRFQAQPNGSYATVRASARRGPDAALTAPPQTISAVEGPRLSWVM